MPAQAQAQELIVYSDTYYSGDSRRLNGDIDDLSDIGFDDRISSARVVSGTWTICTRRDFNGTCQSLTGDVSNFGTTGLNDRISSIRLDSRRGGGRGVTLYDQSDYNGPSVHITDDVQRLGREYGFGNQASSIRVHSGTWEFCANGNYEGRCIRLSADEPNLRSLNLNNDISSLRQIAGGHDDHHDDTSDAGVPLPRGEAVLFERDGFRGDRRSITGEVPNLRTAGFNDRASSLRLGGRWEVCTDINYGGRCEIYRGDVSNLSTEGLNNQISSMRPAGFGRRRSRSGIILFEHVEFSGDQESFNEDVPDLTRWGFNDITSSIQTPVGQWEVCEHANYRGRCWSVRGNERTLVPLGANDRISSVRRIDGGPGGGGGGPRRDDVMIFEHTNFGGRSLGFSEDVPSLASHSFNDMMSSLRINEGRWQFCEHTNYRGVCRTFAADEDNLVPLGMNDRVSSFRQVTDGGGGGDDHHEGIEVFEHADFNGRNLSFHGDVPSLVSFSFNDQLSSFHVHSGQWELCEHVNYGGRCWTYSASQNNVAPLGFNDRISSLRRAGSGGGGGGRSEIVVYEHADFAGRNRTFSDSIQNLVGLGWNDVISSFRIQGGTWEICEHTNYGGRCQRYTSDENNLVSVGWNDRISSIREIP